MALKHFSEFNKIVKKIAKNNTLQYHKDFTTELGGEVARMTPVDTGRATANWTGSINSPDTSPKKKYDTSASSTPTKKVIREAFESAKNNDVLYVSNGVQDEDNGEGYIQFLNEGNECAPFS